MKLTDEQINRCAYEADVANQGSRVAAMRDACRRALALAEPPAEPEPTTPARAGQ